MSCSCYFSALQVSYGLVLVDEFKDHLDEIAQPEALRYYDQLWENCFEAILMQYSCTATRLQLLSF